MTLEQIHYQKIHSLGSWTIALKKPAQVQSHVVNHDTLAVHYNDNAENKFNLDVYW